MGNQNADGPSWQYKIKSFIGECIRVLRITKKPDATEYKTIVKVSGLGILVIGLLGFIIQMFRLLFFA
ncbi:MAG: protein translocase SEC61 complex subunit gamma [Nanoarchaeota archaeon]